MSPSNNSTQKGPNPGIVERVAAVVRDKRLFVKNDSIIVAVSGGSDSLALLYLLQKIDIPKQLIAVYIDHGLRPREIPDEVKTVRECCCSLGIPFLVRSIDVYRLIEEEKRSPEEAARILRYQALEELRREHGAQFIATGHTADDQVEEFFLRLIRGSSRRGLSGMALKRNRVIRPLLHESKKSLNDYLAASNVRWCQDSSNFERQFLRNRVRLELLPLLEKEFNPAIRRTVLQNMSILAEEEDYLARATEEAAGRCIRVSSLPDELTRQLVVQAKAFIDQHPAIRRRILEQCFLLMGVRPAYCQINMISEFMMSGVNGTEIHLDDGVRVEKRRDHLLFCRPLENGRKRGEKAALPLIDLTLAGPGRYLISEHRRELSIDKAASSAAVMADSSKLLIDRSKIVFPLTLRSARPGETFHPYNSPGRKKISRFFNDRKIPAHERTGWPVLLSGETIVALPGLQIDHAFRVTEATTDMLAIGWRKTDSL